MANKQLVPVARWATPMSPVNGDEYDMALDEACHQAAADRTEFLHQWLSTLDGGRSVRLRRFDSVPAMRAAVGNQADIAIVGTDNGFGIYIFVAGSTAPDDAPFCIVPASSQGRWLHLMRELTIGFPHQIPRMSEVPTLDNENRIQPNFLTNAVLGVADASFAHQQGQSIQSTTPVGFLFLAFSHSSNRSAISYDAVVEASAEGAEGRLICQGRERVVPADNQRRTFIFQGVVFGAASVTLDARVLAQAGRLRIHDSNIRGIQFFNATNG